MKARASYVIERQSDTIIVIADVGTGITVTNDAEAVIQEMHERGLLQTQQVLYYDSEGQLDELKHDGKGRFTGFAPGPDRRLG